MTNETQTRGSASEPGDSTPTDAWRAAIASRKTQVARADGIPSVQAPPLETDVSRRRFIRASFWSGLGLTLLGSVGLFLDFFYPRNVKGFGGPVPAGKVSDYPRGGEPKHVLEGQFWLANLDPAETRDGGTGGADGFLALWHKCPHLGCTVPWRGEFDYEGDKGWYRCPCHGSTYTKTGIRVFGPAPRSMDTMLVEIDSAGNITVQTGTITSGGPDNPSRAVLPPA
ncbi:MAG: ubiquinol-cytochrome c reductase iron-sulfur subunit [Dehalococcoidia bacterium]